MRRITADKLMMDSLNVAGLNNPVKRRRIAKIVLAEYVDLVCIQETHLRESKGRYLREVYKGTVSLSCVCPY